ncbi:MAG: DUF1223 domain-containing protein [Devosia sp.]|uniref:DUF1223 domain-containing protein n=1 Tax=Devosia sp. TaxID=1871048 RepID=UPI001AD282D3|nr:DUF1223 domain-containing protein [Devosia sp.]MBN9310975.1 DUF1223 domain-containing protein [Devosia sp.]MBN9316696.1 DUF1223 domain-containing protein [Devosia sp.]
MLFRRILWGFALSLVFASPVLAGEFKLGPRAVLELFTSQGCSSCPKADAMFEQMGKRPDVVTLAYHVDYWDYIGWRDTFGTAANSDRQRDYAEAWGSSRIFTPQMVVNGRGGVVGSKTDAVNGALANATLPLTVSLTQQGGDLIDISVPAQAGLPGGTIWLVTFLDRADVAIERGENEGKKVAYTQIVTGRQVLGVWNPKAGAHLTLPVNEVLTGESNGAVILVQQEKSGLPGPILGAASFTR